MKLYDITRSDFTHMSIIYPITLMISLHKGANITKIRPANTIYTGKNTVIVTFALLMHQNPVHIIKKVKEVIEVH